MQRVARISDRRNLTSFRSIRRARCGDEPKRRKPVAAGEIQKFELSNGLRLLVREDPRLPLVSMTAVFRGGLARGNAGDERHHALAGEGAAQRHDDAHRRADRRQIEAVGGSIGSDAGNNSFSVSLDVTQPDLQTRRRASRRRSAERDHAGEGGRARKGSAARRDQGRGRRDDHGRAQHPARGAFPGHPYALRAKGSAESVAALDAEGSARVPRPLCSWRRTA